MNRLFFAVFFVLFLSGMDAANTVYAQQNEPYLIPRRIFIGDPAVLVVPLTGSSDTASAEDTILTQQSPGFPSHPDIDFHRIILERRAGTSRLLIEFTAFVPGTLELPVIKIEGEYFYDLTVTVSSIIENLSSVILSPPAPSLAMPGTAVLLYGSMAALVIAVLLTIWFVFKGRLLFRKLSEKWKRRMLFVSIRRTERRLYKSVLKEENKRLILDKLSEELRGFLSCLTGVQCRAWTSADFKKFHFKLPLSAEAQAVQAVFLQDFFYRCDKLRFSGAVINSDNIFSLLADLRSFAEALEAGMRKKAWEVKT